MTRFVAFKTDGGSEIYINPDAVAWIRPSMDRPKESILAMRDLVADPDGVTKRDRLFVQGPASEVALLLGR